ncbi:MAG: ATP-binding protein [Sphingomonadaceae bacterium]|nr:ATP-binding protein [Sphingomonadaceae bacterium]
MLLNFTVSNFRSIRDEVTLSMSGGRYRETTEGSRAIKTGFAQFPCALRAAAIYGANASGKSSVVGALEFLQRLVIHSARDESGNFLATLPVCKATSKTEKAQTSLFEINFIEEDVQYTYGVVASQDRIVEEWLHAKTKKGRTRELFSRALEGDEYDWHFSSYFNSKKMTSTWSKATRPNALFLSTAIQLNSNELRPVHEWVTLRLRLVTPSNHLGHMVTSQHLVDEEKDYDALLELVQAADPTITAINVEPNEVEENEFLSVFNEEIRARLLENAVSRIDYDVRVTHKVPGCPEYSLDIEEESDGTQIIYKYAAPFLQSLEHNFVVVVDELDRSLHPLLLERFVALFTEPNDEKTEAQIIFTTHDSALLSTDVIHRDQIWFVDNVGMKGSKLVPLSDFKPRKSDRLQKIYLQGRYRAVPKPRTKMLFRAK